MARTGGALVVFEGGEGSGKSTQLRLLGEWLRGRGWAVVTARDPGTTRVGEAVRSVLLDPGSVADAAELLLYAAARAQLVREVLEPALAAGAVVLLDRYEDSTYAYQGAGRGLGQDQVRLVNEVATRGLRPDLVVLLDVAPAEGLRRRGDAGGEPDRMESEPAGFHERVRAAYRARAAAAPERYLVVDGLGSPTTIQSEVRRRVEALLAAGSPSRRP